MTRYCQEYFGREDHMKITISIIAIVAFMLAAGGIGHADAVYDLCYASYSGDLNKAGEILKKDPAAVNGQSKLNGKMPLHYAAGVGNEKMVEFLVSKGAKLDGKDYVGATPLHDAANFGKTATASQLISMGADPNATTNIKWTPLHYAASYGYKETAELLILRGAKLDARDVVGAMPLHAAAENGHVEVAGLLIEKGADINAPTELFSLTPLHCAVLHENKNMVSFLISKGANINAKDKGGKTPLGLAKQNNIKEIIDILIRSGAKE